MITAKLLHFGGLYLSIEGGNSDNGEIAAKWGSFGTHFGHFCPFAYYQKVEIVITAKLLQNGGTN